MNHTTPSLLGYVLILNPWFIIPKSRRLWMPKTFSPIWSQLIWQQNLTWPGIRLFMVFIAYFVNIHTFFAGDLLMCLIIRCRPKPPWQYNITYIICTHLPSKTWKFLRSETHLALVVLRKGLWIFIRFLSHIWWEEKSHDPFWTMKCKENSAWASREKSYFWSEKVKLEGGKDGDWEGGP